MPRLTDMDRYLRSAPETDVQEALRKLAETLQAPYFHDHDSRRNPTGFPDTVIPVHQVCWMIECKKETEQLEPHQLVWATALEACTEIRWRLARPSNLPEIMADILAGRA